MMPRPGGVAGGNPMPRYVVRLCRDRSEYAVVAVEAPTEDAAERAAERLNPHTLT